MSDILKMFEVDDLRPAQTTARPAVGDQVEFVLADGSAGAIGHVAEILRGEWIKVTIDGMGSFLVPPCRASVLGREH